MLENIDTILGIIGSIFTILTGIIGFVIGFKKGSFTNIDVIEYGLSDSDKQSNMRCSAIIRSTFNVIIIMSIVGAVFSVFRYIFSYGESLYGLSIVGALPFAILVDKGMFVFVFILMVLSSCICVEVLLCWSLFSEKKEEYIQWIGGLISGVIIWIMMLVAIVQIGMFNEFEWLDFVIKIIWIIGLIPMGLWFWFFERKVKQSLFARFRCSLIFVSLVYFESLLGVFYLSLSKQRIFLEKFISSKILSSIEEYIPNKLLWMLLFTIIFIFIVLWINSTYYKMMEKIAFLYYEQGSEKRYIYRKIDNQFLCCEKDYLQWDKKEFSTELEKVKKAIKQQSKKKNWTKENKGDLDNKIKKLARYSGYIRVDEDKKYFKKLKQYIDSDTATVVSIETELIKMIGKFQKMTAVELVPEDELREKKIYPIIDEERSGFFNQTIF